MSWYAAYLIKQALGGSPIMASFMPSPEKSIFDVPDSGTEVSDHRLAEKWLNALAPVYREAPLSRARARLTAQ